jgi:hypothetical protein
MMEDWVEYIKGQIRMYDVPNENIANFDETNVDFSIDATTTLDTLGSQSISVQQASSSQRATVMLGVTMAGEKLAPYVIFKGSSKGTGRVQREFLNPQFFYPAGMAYAVQHKAWMDEEKMIDWIAKVWRPWAATKDGKTYLLLDEFAAHMTTAVREALADCDTEVDFVLGGYTSKLQVMDVGLNRPFKDSIRQEFEAFMVQSESGKPHRRDVAKWIWEAWESIGYDPIVNTWNKVLRYGRDDDDASSVASSVEDNIDPLEMIEESEAVQELEEATMIEEPVGVFELEVAVIEPVGVLELEEAVIQIEL